MDDWYVVMWLALAYALGSVSFAIVVSRVMGLDDPRTYGSQNPGATNVLRTGNKRAAALTLLLDALKGWLPVWAVQAWMPEQAPAFLVAGVALAAFVGHVWPVFFRFQGGKGVATAAGVLFGVHPVLGLATAVTWLIVAVFFRYSSLAALCAAVFAPFYFALGQGLVWSPNVILLGGLVIMSAILIQRHTDNLRRLLRGEETRIGQKKT
ncbi:MAG: glycerol-3-phosphate 1-O-acyltransferase PlsY [Betaproteobacteria bacterium]|jgi:acyl phosphate:glycerol-3-phosphate acyltransferase|nr:glycerol-3-phosphate 1-O-acyltransferase PlsY [Betaproteobacteria bacterium]NBP45583.1 glycerol-3-phosphate 1-O-acyltransferase PlsY [Betaproteobacteria bacterium]